MRLPGQPDDDGYVGGATHATTLAEWDAVGAADLVTCPGCRALVEPEPVCCPLCGASLERAA